MLKDFENNNHFPVSNNPITIGITTLTGKIISIANLSCSCNDDQHIKRRLSECLLPEP